MSLPEIRRAQKIKEVFPVVNGLFSKMNYTFREEVTKPALDIMFISDYGNRNTTPIVEMVQGDSNYGKVLTSEQLTTLAGYILEMYKPRWDKLAQIYEINYDPIHNYLDEWEDTSEEVVDGEGTKTTTGATTYGKMISSTGTRSDAEHLANSGTDGSTVTRTDDLTRTETRNLSDSSTRTDNLSEETTYGKTDTRTDNLSEETTYGKTDTRTDALKAETTYGKSELRTDALKAETTFGKTNTRTDALNTQYTGEEHNTGTDSNTDKVVPFGASGEIEIGATNGSTSDVKSFMYRSDAYTGTQTHALSGKDTVDNTGTQTNALSGKDTIDNTGTQTNALSGKDTTVNTGTQTDALSGKDTTVNTGTQGITSSKTGTLTTTNTGTAGTVASGSKSFTQDTTLNRTSGSTESFTGSDRVNSSNSSTEDVTTNKDRSGSHSGNIGNITSQKMISEEIKLWKWNYMREILDDVKEFCTLPVYLNATEWQII